MGVANKVLENKITGIKVLKEIYPKKKKVLSLGELRSSLGRFHKKDFSSLHLNIEYSQGLEPEKSPRKKVLK